jgi:hypothetical protein
VEVLRQEAVPMKKFSSPRMKDVLSLHLTPLFQVILCTVWRFTFKIALEVTGKVFLHGQKSINQPFLV